MSQPEILVPASWSDLESQVTDGSDVPFALGWFPLAETAGARRYKARQALVLDGGWEAMHEQDGRDDQHDLFPVIPFRDSSAPDEHVSSGRERPEPRTCPWCGSRDTSLVHRGLIGPTDERDQYFSCRSCKGTTFEIVSRTMRDVRVGQFQVGGIYRDSARQAKYRISRVLKVGVNEVLLYLKPIARRENPSADRG